MSSSAILVSAALMLPPLVTALGAGRLAARRSESSPLLENTWRRPAAWITSAFSILYYGGLATLAGINLAHNPVEVDPFFTFGLPIVITVVLTIICLMAYVGTRHLLRAR